MPRGWYAASALSTVSAAVMMRAEAKLASALRKSRFTPPIRSLRRGPDEPDETCWLAGDGWWLSTAPPDA